MAPWFAPAYVNLADLYRLMDREGEAVLQQGLEREAETAAIHHALGLSLTWAERHEEALEVSPVDRELLFGLATISRDSGALREALGYARELAELAPWDPGVRQLVAALERGVS